MQWLSSLLRDLPGEAYADKPQMENSIQNIISHYTSEKTLSANKRTHFILIQDFLCFSVENVGI